MWCWDLENDRLVNLNTCARIELRKDSANEYLVVLWHPEWSDTILRRGPQRYCEDFIEATAAMFCRTSQLVDSGGLTGEGGEFDRELVNVAYNEVIFELHKEKYRDSYVNDKPYPDVIDYLNP